MSTKAMHGIVCVCVHAGDPYDREATDLGVCVRGTLASHVDDDDDDKGRPPHPTQKACQWGRPPKKSPARPPLCLAPGLCACGSLGGRPAATLSQRISAKRTKGGRNAGGVITRGGGPKSQKRLGSVSLPRNIFWRHLARFSVSSPRRTPPRASLVSVRSLAADGLQATLGEETGPSFLLLPSIDRSALDDSATPSLSGSVWRRPASSCSHHERETPPPLACSGTGMDG